MGCSNDEDNSGQDLIKREYSSEANIEYNTYWISKYNGSGQIISRKTNDDARNGNSSRHSVPNEFEYDANGRLISTNTVDFGYDSAGRVISRTGPTKSITQYLSYLDDVITLTDNSSDYVRTFKLDSKNRVIEFNGENNELTARIQYDEFDNITKVEFVPVHPEWWSTKDVIEIEHDSNPNPYLNSYRDYIESSRLFQFSMDDKLWVYLVFFATNNIVKFESYSESYNTETGSYDRSDFTESYQIEHELNSNGFPTIFRISHSLEQPDRILTSNSLVKLVY
ncbi:hypothetical protein [Ulvibacterium sp.]|uniref:hypothetical protein n=1 Tax=Ulvibacterium sp. TaxID=2665914 RepID=UPI003BAD594E